MTRHHTLVPTDTDQDPILVMVDSIAADAAELDRIYRNLLAAAEAEKLNAELALSDMANDPVTDTSDWFITSQIEFHQHRIARLASEKRAVIGDNPKADRTRDRLQGRIEIEQRYLDDLLEAANLHDAACENQTDDRPPL